MKDETKAAKHTAIALPEMTDAERAAGQWRAATAVRPAARERNRLAVAVLGHVALEARRPPVPHEPKDDPINPAHYKAHPSGVECIDIIERFTHNVGAAVKYLWRAGLKTTDPLDDLRKARWYVDREIQRIERDQKLDALAAEVPPFLPEDAPQ